jgi:hypothetical protein
MTTAIQQPGEGTVLAVSISASFVTIAEVVEIDGPGVMVEAIDNTILAGPLIISRPSLFPEPDKLTVKVFFDPNDTITQALFVTDISTPKAIEAYKITFNDQHVTHSFCTFSGFITSFKLNGMKVKSNLGADVEIQLTTLISFTVGSG